MGKPVRVGTRGSALALAQTNLVARVLRARGIEVEVVRIRSAGDENQRDSSTLLGLGVFVKELEQALLDGRIDLAVHSAKDLPTAETAGVSVAAFLTRGDPRDALVSRSGQGLRDLSPGARIGTDSPRRRAFLLAARADLDVTAIRGNVDTRLRKLEAGHYDAIVVAAVGLQRLSLGERIAELLSPEVMLPAVGQGAIAVQAKIGDLMLPLVTALDDPPTRQEMSAERAFLRTVGGGCRAPIAAFARSDGTRIVLDGAVISPDGRQVVRDRMEGPADEASALGAALAERLLARGAAALYAESRA